MFIYSSYSRAAQGLPIQNEFDRDILIVADVSIKIREISKFFFAVGFFALIASADSRQSALIATSFSVILISGASWILGATASIIAEPEAQRMLLRLWENMIRTAGPTENMPDNRITGPTKVVVA